MYISSDKSFSMGMQQGKNKQYKMPGDVFKDDTII
jgi:hypothetical protein